MNVTLIARTEGVGELAGLSVGEILAYVARVSNPSNQMNHETAAKLLGYCLRNQHWSVFESASLTMEIVTSRAIAQQILRHRSFTFQGQPHPVTCSKVVLTTAHVDQDPTNNDPANLRAWCQRCHNTHDARARAAGIKARKAEGAARG